MRAWLMAALLLALLAAYPAGLAFAGARLETWPARAEEGQPMLVRACLGRVAGPVELRGLGRQTPMAQGADGCWWGVIAPDLGQAPANGRLEALVKGQARASLTLQVAAHDYGTRNITVAGKFMELTPGQLARHQDETARQQAVYASRLPEMLWQGAWRVPLDSQVVGPFGRRSLVNGQPRSPHGGVDLRGAEGAPIAAPAAGRVALVLDSFFSGRLVLIDHGLGVVSGYRHLSKVLVQPGQEVRSDQVIGLVGATGRVTGPHLHFDVHLAGARVDPLAWIAASRELARRMGGE